MAVDMGISNALFVSDCRVLGVVDCMNNKNEQEPWEIAGIHCYDIPLPRITPDYCESRRSCNYLVIDILA
ncbi:hypothetical protein RHMOL_Rhmol05G0125000 [Rhododendron molle]|uniref:Uncharacterized protein n=1 Tax=Rhododendron molle TaxID=49168 RepID=A0ACC0NN47_RHOML|nr:hypothetical protein RHMOL_Rhmol05G0125000 [Rhododendron molle]